ncbi:hypothetical protein [Pedobacter nototheniae]|nr:hypothetical protein [Pedobacter nototheniae]
MVQAGFQTEILKVQKEIRVLKVLKAQLVQQEQQVLLVKEG